MSRQTLPRLNHTRNRFLTQCSTPSIDAQCTLVWSTTNILFIATPLLLQHPHPHSLILSASLPISELKRVCALLHEIVAAKFPDNWKVSVAGFMFLRFVCPSIVTPELYQLVEGRPTREARRAMVLVAKVVQNLANGVEFVGKEAYMHALNSFILNNIQTMTDYFETMSAEAPVTDDKGEFILEPIPEDRLDPQTLQTRLLDFYKHLCDNTEKIQEYFYPEDEELESIDYDMVGFTQMLQKTQISNEYQPVTSDKEGEQFTEDEAWVLNGDEEWTDPPRPATEVAADLLEQVQLMYMEHSLGIGQFVRGQSADFWELAGSEIFADFVTNAGELQEVDITSLKQTEKVAFWTNLYNVLVFHIHVTIGAPDSMFARRTFFSVYRYRVGPLAYSLDDMLHGILRANPKKQFGRRDPRRELITEKCDPRVHFAVSNLTVSSPPVRIYYPDRLDSQLKYATTVFLRERVQFKKKEIALPRMFELYRNDFGKNLEEILHWIEAYLTQEQKETMSEMLKAQNFTITSIPLNWKNQIFYDLDDGYTIGAHSTHEVIPKSDVILNCDTMHDKECGHPTEVIEELLDRALSLLAQYAGQSDEIPWAEMAQTNAFKEYLEASTELQQVTLADLGSREEKLMFFINLYHCIVIHYHIMFGAPGDKKKREKFNNNYKYMVNMQLFSLGDIENGVLRGNPKNPVTRHRPFRGGDPRRAFILQDPEPLDLMCLSQLHRGCAPIKKYMVASLEVQITDTLIEWCRRNFHWNPSTGEITYPKSITRYKEDLPQKPLELIFSVHDYMMHIEEEDMAKINMGNVKFTQEATSYEPLPAVDLIQ
eukprot:TRINITY_DN6266_c1_g1_i4.p1 TRINITY_DN6266_c1_g1~~TRINITY_DN6266_c1_g1_i4.p1  ORF type:complete len:824 (+),score=227.18 TRINITY_DN6266_c1_g1_i4:542-3013(+)